MRWTLPFLVVATLLSGCGHRSVEPKSTEPAELTSRAIAVVMLDHVPGDTASRRASHVDEFTNKTLVGAEFRYHDYGVDDGDKLEVTVQRAKLESCRRILH